MSRFGAGVRRVLTRHDALGLAALWALAAFVLHAGVHGPLLSDEFAYLANAAALAGHANDLASSYRAGYSLTLAPGFLGAATPEQIWVWVKLVNAALLLATLVILARIADLLAPAHPRRARLAAASLAAAYPFGVAMTGYALADNALLPLFSLATLLLMLAERRPGATLWLWFGGVVGVMYCVHVRAGVVLLAALAAAGLAALHTRRARPLWATLLAMLAVVSAHELVLAPSLQQRMSISGLPPRFHYASEGDPALLLTSDGVLQLLSRLGGHVFYLTVGSVGLLWFGLTSLLRGARRTAATAGRAAHVLPCFLAASLLGTLLMSIAWFTAVQQPRLDHWLYGRYLESLIPPVLLAGALHLHTYRGWRPFAALVALATGAAALLQLGLATHDHPLAVPPMIVALWQLLLLPRAHELWIWCLTGVAPIVALALAPAPLRRTVIGGVFLVCILAHVRWHERAAVALPAERSFLAELREAYPPGTCVGFDPATLDAPEAARLWLAAGLYLYDYPVRRMSEAAWQAACDGPWITLRADAGLRAPVLVARPRGLAAPSGGPR